ncbi:uncharacterized protein LOC136075539 [Hydra vulgaris]|uniref:Uncharacterized protein LOC136075539 n=1 Tax=Hydra vulgaris TaxID=6087 RepID=A0ABM4B865_HYDVU
MIRIFFLFFCVSFIILNEAAPNFGKLKVTDTNEHVKESKKSLMLKVPNSHKSKIIGENNLRNERTLKKEIVSSKESLKKKGIFKKNELKRSKTCMSFFYVMKECPEW